MSGYENIQNSGYYGTLETGFNGFADKITVSELNRRILSTISQNPELKNIYVSGELSGVKISKSGHIYFSLKDENGEVVDCAIFASAAMRLSFQPHDGEKVIAFGSCSYYGKGGKLSFVCTSLKKDGIGKLFEELEKLKKKLAAEGLFDEKYKKPLPKLPKGIGVCTAGGGAVIHDILTTANRRFPGMPIILFPCPVQGQGAASQIITALQKADNDPRCDVIIVGRGGGSVEDLWCFNDEALARAVFACKKPVVSAVGHESDNALTDLVASKRAATPTAAAELCVPVKAELLESLQNMRARLDAIPNKITMSHYDMQNKADRMEKSLSVRLKNENARLHNLSSRLSSFNAEKLVLREKMNLAKIKIDFSQIMKQNFDEKKHNLEVKKAKLKLLGPDNVLSRGYSVLLTKTGDVVESKDTLKVGESFDVMLKDGKIEAQRI